ncbi:MAG TPA: hypothetical protein VFC53_03810 [Dehalococcoidia bacterium]|nr:hypothetical protein [Dehalococcoidia bacterium]
MRIQLKRGPWLGVALALALAGTGSVLAACGGGTSSADKTSTAVARGATGGTQASSTPEEDDDANYTATPSTGAVTPQASGTPAAGAATGAAALKVANVPNIGMVLTDGAGLTLYTFKNDVANSGKSSVPASILPNWPPLTTDGTPTKTADITGELTTFTGSDGKTWVAYKGMPLYHFINDKAPGDAKGQGIGGVWFAAQP